MKRGLHKGLGALLLAGAMLLSACGSGNSNAPANKGGSGTSPQPGKEQTEEAKVLKVSFFEGGYGRAWFDELKKGFESTHENVTVELEGDPGIAEKIGPRIESGTNLPDVVYMPAAWVTMAAKGQLLDLTDLYNGPSADGGVFKDTLTEAAQKAALYQDTPYVIPWSDGVLGMAYNAGMFEEHGWEVPATWAEFAELAEKITAEGIAPIVYPGQVITYWDFAIRPLIVQAGGLSYIDEALAMESPEVMNNPAKLRALQQYEELFKHNWLMNGSSAMNHTEAQMQFVNGKAAMIPNGNWLENEMKASLPAGFRMKMMSVPLLDNAQQTGVYYSLVGPEVSFIPAKAAEPELAKEFIRFAASKEMNRKFTELTGSFRPFKYELDGIDVSEFTKSVSEIMQNNIGFAYVGGEPMWFKIGGLFPSGDPFGAIATGQLTAQQQFDNDYKFAKENWEAFKKELNLE